MYQWSWMLIICLCTHLALTPQVLTWIMRMLHKSLGKLTVMKKFLHLSKYWGSLIIIIWIGVLTFSLLLKLPSRKQPWESVAAFGNAVVNAALCWFYDGKKMPSQRFSHMRSFFSGFTVLLIIPERFNLVYN